VGVYLFRCGRVGLVAMMRVNSGYSLRTQAIDARAPPSTTLVPDLVVAQRALTLSLQEEIPAALLHQTAPPPSSDFFKGFFFGY
jgi:hypothetical protein